MDSRRGRRHLFITRKVGIRFGIVRYQHHCLMVITQWRWRFRSSGRTARIRSSVVLFQRHALTILVNGRLFVLFHITTTAAAAVPSTGRHWHRLIVMIGGRHILMNGSGHISLLLFMIVVPCGNLLMMMLLMLLLMVVDNGGTCIGRVYGRRSYGNGIVGGCGCRRCSNMLMLMMMVD